VNVSASRSIVDDREIPKSGILRITRDSGISDSALHLQLPSRSQSVSWYASVISLQLEPWLKRYSHSALRNEMLQKIEKFREEMARVQKGEFREGNTWYSAAERAQRMLDIEAEDLFTRMQAAVANADYLGYADLLEKCPDTCRNAAVYPKITTFARNTAQETTPEMIRNSIGRIRASMEAGWNETVFRIQKIVNQPVRSQLRTSNMAVATYEGWFHPGAIKPDFNHVNVRTTQERNYDKHQYVASDFSPNIVYVGSDLEFNSMTKYFYTDRSVPKKKLTESEMVEINRLYRILGRIEKDRAGLADLANNPSGLQGRLKQLADHLALPTSRSGTAASFATNVPTAVATVLASAESAGSEFLKYTSKDDLKVYGIYALCGVVVLWILMGLGRNRFS